jgi:rSAM/selenodomain-associated transferase 2
MNPRKNYDCPEKMISVIIPTLNEAQSIAACLERLYGHPQSFEVIVADGGSQDQTSEIVSNFPRVKQVFSNQGKGRQMNAGADLAVGDILLFLHADTFLPPDGFRLIRTAMSDPNVVGGSFSLSFDSSDLFLKFYSLCSRINHILFTYGDQAMFVGRESFRAIGGYRDIPIMEDIDIQLKLRRMGKFKKIGTPVVTSARRYLKYGVIRQQIVNTGLVILYYSGVLPAALKRFYPENTEG